MGNSVKIIPRAFKNKARPLTKKIKRAIIKEIQIKKGTNNRMWEQITKGQ